LRWFRFCFCLPRNSRNWNSVGNTGCELSPTGPPFTECNVQLLLPIIRDITHNLHVLPSANKGANHRPEELVSKPSPHVQIPFLANGKNKCNIVNNFQRSKEQLLCISNTINFKQRFSACRQVTVQFFG
jgi:hypothetical protein